MRKKFPAEFKRDVVAVARRGQLTQAEIASDFGVRMAARGRSQRPSVRPLWH